MRTYPNRAAALVVFVLLAGSFSACAGTQEAVERREAASAARAEKAERARQNLDLVAPSADVRTIQLYSGSEQELPILRMGAGGGPLTLEFDVLGSSGRPLSVYFYHANRAWERDLMPVEYMATFERDDILDFAYSRATDQEYIHYTYTFPNDVVGFRVSGNYIVRVAEQGDPEAVLFERPFFVTENTASTQMDLASVMLSGAYASTVPLLQFIPPQALGSNPFDYGVCYLRNGRYELARCSTTPMMGAMPALRYELEPEMAFRPEAADYFVDLSAVRVNHYIEQADPSTSPPSVTVKPDYANFGGSLGSPVLNGQAVVSGAVETVANPDVNAEYMEAGFSLVPPDDLQFASPVYIVGSFSGWNVDEQNRMTWVPERGRYEVSVLLKQGHYEYRYESRDQRFRRAQSLSPPRSESTFLGFVYYRDSSLNTDRLIGVDGIVTQ